MYQFSRRAWASSVPIRLRVGDQAPVRRIYLRYFPDGEQSFILMHETDHRPPARWWEAELPILEPSVRYRFLLVTDEGVWWLTAGGIVNHDPLDHSDFRILADYDPPSWLQNTVFYQIYPDRFANGDPNNDPRPDEYEYRGLRPQLYPWGTPLAPKKMHILSFFGGDLQGVVQHLDHLEELGVNAIYLNPIFSAYTSHKYDTIDYHHVDPHLGGDEALIALRRALDERRMRYILDIVPNHCGSEHPWFLSSKRDHTSPEAEFFTFTRHPDEYLSWMGHTSLVKLNYRSTELRRRMYAGTDAIFRHWLKPPFCADGWRVDVANMLGRQGAQQMNQEVIREIRRAVKETRPDSYLIGENFFDASDQLQGDGWDGVMNYMGLAMPLENWLRGYQQGALGLAEVIESPVPYPTSAMIATWRAHMASIPWIIGLQQYNLLGSHDTSRIRSVVGSNDALHRLAAVVQLTFPGVPAIYYGDEIGLLDDPGVRATGCMDWDRSHWNQSLFAFYQGLIALRRASPVLQRGGFQMLLVEPDTFAYQRDGNEGWIVVVAHRAETPRLAGPLPVAHGSIPDGTRFVERFTGQERIVQDGVLPLPEQAQGASLWEAY